MISLASTLQESVCPRPQMLFVFFYYYTRPCKMSTSLLSSVLHLGKVGGPAQQGCWVLSPNPYALSPSLSLAIQPGLTGKLPWQGGAFAIASCNVTSTAQLLSSSPSSHSETHLVCLTSTWVKFYFSSGGSSPSVSLTLTVSCNCWSVVM